MAKKRPTQADVAARAGVSQTTVSLVVNNNTDFSVPAETRQRVVDVINELGYVPDRSARSLRTNKTYTIASIIPDITNPFYPAFERGIQDVAERQGYDLIVYNTDGVREKECKCLRSALQGRVDGIIAVPFHLSFCDLAEVEIPTVQLAQKPNEALAGDVVFVDNAAAACTAVTYLLERGYTRVGMIAGQENTPPRQNRIAGYRQALLEHHLPLEEILIQNGDFTEQGGYQGMRHLLTLAPRPTAVFAANDLMAMGVLLAVREAGLRVPEDIAVVGFDDIPAAKLVNPPLTTVTQFEGKIGQRAAEMLFERINGTAPKTWRAEEMPYQLIVRESA